MPGLGELTPGARVAGPLLVLAINPRALGSHDATVLTLGDASGRVPTAPFWSEARARIAGLHPGDVVEVLGRVGTYRGRRQLEVERIRRVECDPASRRGLLPAVGDVTPWWRQLDTWRAEIRATRLRQTLDLFFDDLAFRERYETCPASLSGHHAALGGLLRHCFEVSAIGRVIAGLAGADQDLVLAGALLHDIGKLEAYSWDGPFELTGAGALLGHVALGARMLDRRVQQASTGACEGPELEQLLHLVLSHHGRLEFGAAVQPATLEAEILHQADDASAKSASMADALADPANFLGDAALSARSIWQLDRRRVYRRKADGIDLGPNAERPPSRG